MNTFFKYLIIGILSTILGVCWGGSALIGFSFFFGSIPLLINAGILTYLDQRKVK